MAFYTTTINSDRPAKEFCNWLKEKMVLNGWEAVETAELQPTGTNTAGTVSSATSATLVKTYAGWVTGAYIGYSVTITGGTGAGQTRAITSNSTTSLSVSPAWATIPDNTSTYRIDPLVTEVMRSPASNSLGIEFYVYLHRLYETNTSVYITISEAWDTNTKKKIRYAPYGVLGVAAADFTVNDPTGLLHSSYTGDSYNAGGISVDATHTLTVDKDHFILGRLNGAAQNTNMFFYAGVFDRLLPAALDVMPIIATNAHYSAGNNYGRCTRDPGLTPGTYSTGAWTAYFGSAGTEWYQYAYAFSTNSTNNQFTYFNTTNPYTGATYPAARVVFATGRATAFPRGLLKDVLTCVRGNTPGDTLAVTNNGVTKNYVLVSTPAGGLSQNTMQLYVPSE